jgi:hypothetical protein
LLFPSLRFCMVSILEADMCAQKPDALIARAA